MDKKQTMTFEEWLAEIDRLARADDFVDGSYVEATGNACWRDGYDDGLTPEKVWAEEKSCWGL